MSYTKSAGVHDADHYSYLSKVLSVKLDSITYSGEIKSDTIPRSLYLDMNVLVDTANDGLLTGRPKNPPANAAAVNMLSYLFRKNGHPLASNEILMSHLEFLKSLNNPRKLEPKEIGFANILSGVFLSLHNIGNSQNYTRRMGEICPNPWDANPFSV